MADERERRVCSVCVGAASVGVGCGGSSGDGTVGCGSVVGAGAAAGSETLVSDGVKFRVSSVVESMLSLGVGIMSARISSPSEPSSSSTAICMPGQLQRMSGSLIPLPCANLVACP